MAIAQEGNVDLRPELWTAHPQTAVNLGEALGAQHVDVGNKLLGFLIEQHAVPFEDKAGFRGLSELLGESALTTELPVCPFADRCKRKITFSVGTGSVEDSKVRISCGEMADTDEDKLRGDAAQCLATHRTILGQLGMRTREVVGKVDAAREQQELARLRIANADDAISAVLGTPKYLK